MKNAFLIFQKILVLMITIPFSTVGFCKNLLKLVLILVGQLLKNTNHLVLKTFLLSSHYMTRVQKVMYYRCGGGQKKRISLTKKGHFWQSDILFQGRTTKQKRRDLAKIFRSKVLGRPPSAIAVCLSVMMVVWECCTRNR